MSDERPVDELIRFCRLMDMELDGCEVGESAPYLNRIRRILKKIDDEIEALKVKTK